MRHLEYMYSSIPQLPEDEDFYALQLILDPELPPALKKTGSKETVSSAEVSASRNVSLQTCSFS